MAYIQNPKTEITQEDLNEIEREAGAETISLKDFKDIWDQLDDYRKIEILMKTLTDSCRYYPEFISPFEILAWEFNLNINPEDREVAKYQETNRT